MNKDAIFKATNSYYYMLRRELKARLSEDRVDSEIIEIAHLAYDYLNDRTKCPSGEEYSWEIADALLGPPKASWNLSRAKVQTALEILEYRGVLEKIANNGKYAIKTRLE